MRPLSHLRSLPSSIMPRARFLLSACLAVSPAAAELLPRLPPTPPPAKETAVAKPLSGDAVDKLLAQLKEIDSSFHAKRSAYTASLLPRLQEAGTNEDKAFALWLEATKDQNFEAEGKSATEFSDFRNGKAKDLRNNGSFATQLRLQCRFLSLVILQADAESDSQRLEVINGASAYLEDFVTSSKKLTGRQDELRGNALESVIARHLKLDVFARKTAGPAAYNPGNIGGIYQAVILPFYREQRAVTALNAAWSRRISQETALVEQEKSPEQLEKFQKERLPELKWSQAKDLFELGQEEPAAAAMVAIIKANLGHRSTTAWIEELSNLVQATTTPAAAGATAPAPGPGPAPAPAPAPGARGGRPQ